MLAELIFLFGIDATRVRILCSFIAIALHYLFLSAFCWMLLEGYQLYLMLIQVFETDETKIFLYYLFGYGFSAIIVAISAGISFENYGTINYCWLNAETPIIWSFVGPISFIIFANLIFLFAALKAVLSVKNSAVSRSMRIFGWLKGSTMLLCLLGITWTFGYLMAIAPAKTIFAYIFTLLNCLQGVFIFIFHVVMNEKVGTTVVRSIKTCICGCDNSNIGSNISSQPSKGDSHPSSNSTGLNSPGNKSLTPQDAPLFTFTASSNYLRGKKHASMSKFHANIENL
ncbi:unnamed protein product [Dracunculus medinensis]|uniref:G-protein coupled receptors family 2 profile 2 domain-containing protein n=1 Tax=Dracunculus medinensis TaxID=318479 RepID=A0A3P7SDX6_DRAME|nr:unnamed protein product [Dracunculus medinensis]